MRVPLDIQADKMDSDIATLATAITQAVHDNKDNLQATFTNIEFHGGLTLTHNLSFENLLEAYADSIANVNNAAAENQLSHSFKSAVIDALSSCNDASTPLFRHATFLPREAELEVLSTFGNAAVSFVEAYTLLFNCYAGIIIQYVLFLIHHQHGQLTHLQ